MQHRVADHTASSAPSCARQPDWFLSCVCPPGYQVRVRYNAVETYSTAWWGTTFVGMTTNRGPLHPMGPNPVSVPGTGIKYIYTERSVVYYGRGSGAPAEKISWMDASCQLAWLPAPQEEV